LHVRTRYWDFAYWFRRRRARRRKLAVFFVLVRRSKSIMPVQVASMLPHVALQHPAQGEALCGSACFLRHN